MQKMLHFITLFHSEKRTVGVFWQNAAETWIDISSNVADKVLSVGQQLHKIWS